METFVHGCHHDSGEHAAYLPYGGENGGAFRDFERFAMLALRSGLALCWSHDLLPRSEDVYCSTVQTCLEEALEEADYAQLCICFTSCGAHRQARPHE
jgi:hypothetical protein